MNETFRIPMASTVTLTNPDIRYEPPKSDYPIIAKNDNKVVKEEVTDEQIDKLITEMRETEEWWGTGMCATDKRAINSLRKTIREWLNDIKTKGK